VDVWVGSCSVVVSVVEVNISKEDEVVCSSVDDEATGSCSVVVASRVEVDISMVEEVVDGREVSARDVELSVAEVVRISAGVQSPQVSLQYNNMYLGFFWHSP